jgi:ribonuclease M5
MLGAKQELKDWLCQSGSLTMTKGFVMSPCPELIRLKQAVIVEGKCDRVILTNVLSPDTVIIPVNGFAVYKDKPKISLIRRYAESVGVILLTDSDNPGRQIRNFIKQALRNYANCDVRHVYVPNLLEVEDTAIAILRERLLPFAVTTQAGESAAAPITREMLFDAGLIGGANSSRKRREFLQKLDLPENLSVNALLDVLNLCSLRENYESLVENLKWYSQA